MLSVIVECAAHLSHSLNLPISVLRKNAGFSELDVSVHDPAGQNLPLKMKSLAHDVDVIELQPSIPGDYTFRITYGGDPIPGIYFLPC